MPAGAEVDFDVKMATIFLDEFWQPATMHDILPMHDILSCRKSGFPIRTSV